LREIEQGDAGLVLGRALGDGVDCAPGDAEIDDLGIEATCQLMTVRH
jgi:hypothetical protein